MNWVNESEQALAHNHDSMLHTILAYQSHMRASTQGYGLIGRNTRLCVTTFVTGLLNLLRDDKTLF